MLGLLSIYIFLPTRNRKKGSDILICLYAPPKFVQQYNAIKATKQTKSKPITHTYISNKMSIFEYSKNTKNGNNLIPRIMSLKKKYCIHTLRQSLFTYYFGLPRKGPLSECKLKVKSSNRRHTLLENRLDERLKKQGLQHQINSIYLFWSIYACTLHRSHRV